MHRPIIAITMGDAAGVGPEIVVKPSRAPRSRPRAALVIGDAEDGGAAAIAGAAERPSRRWSDNAAFTAGTIDCVDLGLIPDDLAFGRLSPWPATPVLHRARRVARDGKAVDAIYAAPFK
jgi:4-hydroxythreonine-4-phosphate dehydrogenase